MTPPLVSIITVVYNDAALIDITIKSVAKYKSCNVEYIVIDGGSTDHTIDIIKSNSKIIDNWLSEPDNGIYDAINKGIKRANGYFLYFINAGDELIQLPIEQLKANKNTDLLCFPVLLSTHEVFYPHIGRQIKIRNTLPHQGCFYKKTEELFYDTNFIVFADFSLNQTLYKNKKIINVFKYPVVAKHSLDGISHNKKHGLEIFKVVLLNFGPFYQAISFLYFKLDGLKHRIIRLLK